jgi:hypothetical protein
MSDIKSAEHWLSWIRRGKNIATFLVAIGVAGEFVMDFWAEPFNATIEHAREATLANARLEQERLKADNLRLEAIVQPRRLKPEQEVAFRCAVAKFAGEKFKVSIPNNDLEALLLAIQLQNILRDAQWDDDGSKIARRLDDMTIGVAIIPSDGPNGREAAEGLINALTANDVFAGPAPDSGIPWSGGPMEIRVGVKPLPGLADVPCDKP